MNMDPKALYNISYGVFLLGTKAGDKINACITNTCFQAAASPVRLAISCINNNLTCQMIKESKVFSLSVLDTSCSFDTIKHFGYQSGRDVDKFEGISYSLDSNGCPYITKEVSSVFECKVVSEDDLGTHTLFIAEVTDSKVISSNPPLTYAEYQANVKPKKAESPQKPEKKIVGWRCKICGYEYQGSELPSDYECPLCGHPAEDFEPIYA